MTRWAGPLVVAGGVLAATVALRLRDPHVEGSWGLCPWKLLTGWDCPGCGGLRAVNDLSHGDVGAAASSNFAFVAMVPVLAVAWLLWLRRTTTGRRARPVPGWVWTTGLVALGVFTVLRNTPAGAWLAS